MEGEGAGGIYESFSADDKRARIITNIVDLRRIRATGNADLLDNPNGNGKQRKLGRHHLTQAANDLHSLSQMIDDALLGGIQCFYNWPPRRMPISTRIWFACNEALGKFLD
jgi:hypothetical protein